MERMRRGGGEKGAEDRMGRGGGIYSNLNLQIIIVSVVFEASF